MEQNNIFTNILNNPILAKNPILLDTEIDVSKVTFPFRMNQKVRQTNGTYADVSRTVNITARAFNGRITMDVGPIIRKIMLSMMVRSRHTVDQAALVPNENSFDVYTIIEGEMIYTDPSFYAVWAGRPGVKKLTGLHYPTTGKFLTDAETIRIYKGVPCCASFYLGEPNTIPDNFKCIYNKKQFVISRVVYPANTKFYLKAFDVSIPSNYGVVDGTLTSFRKDGTSNYKDIPDGDYYTYNKAENIHIETACVDGIKSGKHVYLRFINNCGGWSFIQLTTLYDTQTTKTTHQLVPRSSYTDPNGCVASDRALLSKEETRTIRAGLEDLTRADIQHLSAIYTSPMLDMLIWDEETSAWTWQPVYVKDNTVQRNFSIQQEFTVELELNQEGF